MLGILLYGNTSHRMYVWWLNVILHSSTETQSNKDIRAHIYQSCKNYTQKCFLEPAGE